MVGVTVLALRLAAGVRSAPGVSRSTLSFSVSLGPLVSGLAAPLSGRAG